MLRYCRNKPFKTVRERVAFINRCRIVIKILFKLKISQRGQCNRKVDAYTLLSILNTVGTSEYKMFLY